MIARAMGLQPRLVVADEAVSMLDVSMRVSVLDLLLSLRTEQQLAYVFISHDFGVVRYFSRTGRIIVMFFGVIVEEGPAESVISHPRHPYTFLLLDAIPVPDPRLAHRRRTEATSKAAERVTGEPSAVGCVFSNRCPFVEDKCRSEAPPLAEMTPGSGIWWRAGSPSGCRTCKHWWTKLYRPITAWQRSSRMEILEKVGSKMRPVAVVFLQIGLVMMLLAGLARLLPMPNQADVVADDLAILASGALMAVAFAYLRLTKED